MATSQETLYLQILNDGTIWCYQENEVPRDDQKNPLFKPVTTVEDINRCLKVMNSKYKHSIRQRALQEAIPTALVNLTLNCRDDPNIRNISPTLVNLITLDCSKCPKLRSIPKTLVNLTTLDCYDCRNLQAIPETLVNLTKLNCYDCPNLQAIPKTLVNLTALNCGSCLKLQSIP